MKLDRDKTNSILKVSGLLDIDSADAVRAALLDFVEPPEGNGWTKRLNLGGVESCDVSALQVLLAARKSAASLGNQLQFQPVSASMAGLAEALGLSIGEVHAA